MPTDRDTAIDTLHAAPQWARASVLRSIERCGQMPCVHEDIRLATDENTNRYVRLCYARSARHTIEAAELALVVLAALEYAPPDRVARSVAYARECLSEACGTLDLTLDGLEAAYHAAEAERRHTREINTGRLGSTVGPLGRLD